MPFLRAWRSRAPAMVLLVVCLTGRAGPQAAPPAAAVTTIVTGHVVDGGTLAALPGVGVLLLGGSPMTTTDAAGNFCVTIGVRGSVTLVLRKLGYSAVGVPLTVELGDSLHVATRLARLPQDLDTLRVTGASDRVAPPRFAGFERRRKVSQGTFITREQLQRTGAVSIGDVLRRIPSITVTRDELGILAIESARGGRLDRHGALAPCRVRIMIDGFLMPFDTPMPVTSPKELHGIEVYSGPATTPRELIPHGDDAFCGLVAMWTR